MSKRNKRKNKHQFQSSEREGTEQSSEGVVEAKPVTLDEHLSDLALQSIQVPSTDMADTTIAKADDVVPQEVQKEVKPEEKKEDKENKAVVAETSKTEIEGISSRTVWAFGGGLLIGAIITSIFL